jgi:hypothetical protein
MRTAQAADQRGEALALNVTQRIADVSRAKPEAPSRPYCESVKTAQTSGNHVRQEFRAPSSGQSDRAIDLAHLDVIGSLARSWRLL